ncbi:hypothetical protein [Halomonas sp. KO116]|uniref:hypothetical protein n=1 Tax=Halomonas sp. KO116 TaxID=1504981 RepID=UPI0004E3E826|nr:hypothetical protein [Halomonas sp. KO116]AJY53193.1 hypothetical protein KO116_P200086 [Halomonas sp. KO116]
MTTTKLLVEVTQVCTYERVIEVEHYKAVDLAHHESDEEIGMLFNGWPPKATVWEGALVSEVADSVPVTLMPQPERAKSALQLALDALELASTDGAELDRDYYLEAHQSLKELVANISNGYHTMNYEERPPMGDDYNELLEQLGLYGS